MMYYIG